MIWWPQKAGACGRSKALSSGRRNEVRKARSRSWRARPTRRFTFIAMAIPIGRAVLQIDDPRRPLGSHVFTMLSGLSDKPSAFVRGRPAHQWMAVETEGNTTLADLGRRVRVPPEFAEKVYDIVSPGTTIVVTDAPALPSTSVHARGPADGSGTEIARIAIRRNGSCSGGQRPSNGARTQGESAFIERLHKCACFGKRPQSIPARDPKATRRTILPSPPSLRSLLLLRPGFSAGAP